MSKYVGRFVWYDLNTTDSTAAQAFYSKVIGWNMKNLGEQYGGYTVIEAGYAGVGGISVQRDSTNAQPRWIGYIAVDDVETMSERVTSAGGSIVRPPADIPEIGRFAVVADPGGACFIIFKPNPGQGERPEPEPGAPGLFGWHELYASDQAVAIRFYETLFGWTKSSEFDMGSMGIYHLFAIDGVTAGGIMTKYPESSQASWNYYITVNGADAAMERVTAAGGTVTQPSHEVPGGGWIVQATDPQGGRLSLLSPSK